MVSAEIMRLALRARVRAAQLRAPGQEAGTGVCLNPTAKVYAKPPERVVLGDHTTLHRHVLLIAQGGWIELGSDCGVSPYAVLYGHGGLKIGSGTSLQLTPSSSRRTTTTVTCANRYPSKERAVKASRSVQTCG